VARAYVLTVSDRSARGERADETGPLVVARLRELGHEPELGLVPDDPPAIAAAVRTAAAACALVVVAGGTGLGPRDVTPDTVGPLLDRPVPGLGELMRAEGRRSTPLAALSRSLGGVLGRTLVLVVPGSPRGALESLEAVVPVLEHALQMLAGADHPAVR
jgi:molybdenum cofactor synthesis domain-containing protein